MPHGGYPDRRRRRGPDQLAAAGPAGVRKMAGSPVAITGCNGGDRHPASGVAGLPAYNFQGQDAASGVPTTVSEGIKNRAGAAPGSLERPLQPLRGKTRSLSRAGFARERAGGEGAQAQRRAYLDTPIATSSPQVFEGTTVQFLENRRRKQKAKQVIQIYHALVSLGLDRDAKALIACGNWFTRYNFPCGTYKLVPCHCNSPFCPICARHRSEPLQHKVLSKMKPEMHYWHFTATVPNLPTLTRAGIEKLVQDFAALRETLPWKEFVLGGVYSIESTFNRKTKTWHPHLHVLLETAKRLPMPWIFKVRAEWQRITGAKVVHLEPMYGVDGNGKKRRKVNMRAIRELVKYATKAASFAHSPERVGEFLEAFHGVRRIQSFGSFLGVEKEHEGSVYENSGQVGCFCGQCHWCNAVPAGLVHLRDTVLMQDGTRQLRLFDSGTDPPFNPEEFDKKLEEFERGLGSLHGQAEAEGPSLFPLHAQ